MRKTIFCSGIFVAVLMFLTALPVCANLTGYAVTTRDGAENVLYSIDLTTGTATVIGSTGITYPSDIVEGLAIDSSRNLFAITANSKLYNIDVTTGAASLIGDTGRLGGIEGLDFFGDVLYGIDFNGFGDYNQRVFSINTLNAATVDVAELQNPGGIRAPASMAALNSTTMLITPYLEGEEGYSYLYSVDLTTGVPTQIGPIVVPASGDYEGSSYSYLFVGGLDFAPDGTLYGIGAIGGDRGKVVRINPNTAEATLIGDTGDQLWLGLAIPSERPLGALPVSQCINLVEMVNPETGLPEKFSARVRNDFDGCIIEASVIFYKGLDCTGAVVSHSFQDRDEKLVYKSGTRGGCAEAVEVRKGSPVCVTLTLKSGRKTTVCY